MAECNDSTDENLVNQIVSNSTNHINCISSAVAGIMIPEEFEKIPQWKEEFLRRKEGFKNCCCDDTTNFQQTMSNRNSIDRMANPAAVISNNNNDSIEQLTTPINIISSTGHSHSQQHAQLSSPTALTEAITSSEITSSSHTIIMSANNITTTSTNSAVAAAIIDSTTHHQQTTKSEESDVTTRFFTATDEQETQQFQQLNSRHDIDHIVSSVAPISSIASTNIVQINSLSPLPAVTVVVASSSSSSSQSQQQSNNIVETKKCLFTKNNNLVNINNGNKSNTVSSGKYTKLSDRNNKSAVSAASGVINKINNSNSNNNNNNSNTMVAMHDMVNEENFSFDDTSEELQYGPGIVSKLRCRYLSLALRQSSNKQRPSLDNLRRATSLNNLLDEDEDTASTTGSNRTSWQTQCNGDQIYGGGGGGGEQKARTPDEYVMSFVRKEQSANDSNRCRQINRGNDSLKRARSVEALMRYDNKAWQRDISKDSNEMDEEINHTPAETLKMHRTVNTDVIVSIEDKIINARERGEHKPKRLTSFMDETERPPPDLVKHTLRIFEATANRRTINSRLGNGDVAAKVATFKSIISQEKPAIIFPKPPLSPKKPMTKPRSNISSSPVKQNLMNGKSPVVKPSIDIQSIKMNLEKSSNNGTTTNTTPPPPPTNGLCNGVKKLPDYCRSPSPSLALRIENANAYRTSKLESPLSPQLVLKTNAAINRPHLDFSHISSPAIKQRNDSESPDLLLCRNNISAGSDIELPTLAKKFENLSIETQVPKSIIESSSSSQSENGSLSLSNNIIETDCVDDSECNSSLRHISKIALANISKAGTTTEFKFSSPSSSTAGPMNKSHLPGYYNGSNLPAKKFTDISEPNVRQIGIIRPQVKATVTSPIPPPAVPLRHSPSAELPKYCAGGDGGYNNSHETSANTSELDKPKRDNLLITNLLTNISVPTLTSQEIEKNLINREKSEEAKWQTVGNSAVQQTVSKLSSSASSSQTSSPSQKSWQSADTQNNSMVFNFSNRKNIPDYIENDGLVFRHKRELPKPGESGFVLLGDLTLETSTDSDDAWTLGPPSPCDVEFLNDNVIIDGKSSIRDKSKNSKLKIHFSDTLTRTFEYPSENSLLEDADSLNDNGVLNNGLLGNSPIGSAPLGSYTPIKGSLHTNFELGVTRSQTSTPTQFDTSSYDLAGPSTNGDNNTSTDSLQYLKPATDEQTVAWSEGTRVTDLLF